MAQVIVRAMMTGRFMGCLPWQDASDYTGVLLKLLFCKPRLDFVADDPESNLVSEPGIRS